MNTEPDKIEWVLLGLWFVGSIVLAASRAKPWFLILAGSSIAAVLMLREPGYSELGGIPQFLGIALFPRAVRWAIRRKWYFPTEKDELK